MRHGLKVKIWGTRGSMAAPYSDRMIFGGNTACVSAQWDKEVAIFDCGTGIRALAEELLPQFQDGVNVFHIFISHVHLDHVIGLPFFPFIYKKDCILHFYGASDEKMSFEQRMKQVAGPPYWPVSLDAAGAEMYWHDVNSGDRIDLPGGAVVRALHSNHPDCTLIFRLEKEDASMVYGLDYELTEDFASEYKEFIASCDLLLFDGMYSDSEIDQYRGFGHSTWEQGVQVAEECQVKRLCISHHDWGKTDNELMQLEEAAKKRSSKCIFAREGMMFHLEEGGEVYVEKR